MYFTWFAPKISSSMSSVCSSWMKKLHFLVDVLNSVILMFFSLFKNQERNLRNLLIQKIKGFFLCLSKLHSRFCVYSFSMQWKIDSIQTALIKVDVFDTVKLLLNKLHSLIMNRFFCTSLLCTIFEKWYKDLIKNTLKSLVLLKFQYRK